MKIYRKIPLLFMAAVALPALAVSLQGKQYLKHAKVAPEKARGLALKAYPGKIVSEELEPEKGGSGLRYSFDIKHAGVTHEVGIDAKTGALLENSVEGADND